MRFTYIDPSFAAKKFFDPHGKTSECNTCVLTADHMDHRIHIPDEDGHILLYIVNCGLRVPWDLYVDKKDNLFVAEKTLDNLKKIKKTTH